MSAIITTNDMSNFSGTTLDKNFIVNAVNQWIETRTHRVWGTTKQVTEQYDWSRRFWLRHQDVVSIDAITLGFPGQVQTTVPTNGYYVNRYGRVTLLTAFYGWNRRHWYFSDYMSVTYTYGNPVVPDDLKQAALAIAGIMYNHANSNFQSVVAESVGSYRVEFAGAVRGAGNGTPNPANNTAEQYYQVIDSYATRRQ